MAGTDYTGPAGVEPHCKHTGERHALGRDIALRDTGRRGVGTRVSERQRVGRKIDFYKQVVVGAI